MIFDKTCSEIKKRTSPEAQQSNIIRLISEGFGSNFGQTFKNRILIEFEIIFSIDSIYLHWV